MIDEKGNVIPEKTEAESAGNKSPVGELVYAGPNVALGYAVCAEDLAKGDEFHGILHAGDMACRDGDGYFYIVGRQSRFIKSAGSVFLQFPRFPAAVPERFNTVFLIIDEKSVKRPHSFSFITGAVCIYVKSFFCKKMNIDCSRKGRKRQLPAVNVIFSFINCWYGSQFPVLFDQLSLAMKVPEMVL